MSHPHSHGAGGCSSEGQDHHDVPEAEGHRDNLYTRVDRDNVVALNVENAKGSVVIKPWHDRMDEEVVRISHGTNKYKSLFMRTIVP